MKEHPILFSSPMVKAILSGTKTQTRRGIKRINDLTNEHFCFTLREVKPEFGYAGFDGLLPTGEICSYGKPCDTLWVRETVRLGAWREDGRMAFDYKASPELKNTPWVVFENDLGGEKFEKLWIKVSDELIKKGIDYDKNGQYHWEPGCSPLNWKPSIFMYKEACRIRLEITNIRVEKLCDITEEDAIAEGIESNEKGIYKDYLTGEFYRHPKESYLTLWTKINGKDSWSKNPWVWVIEFKVKEILK